MISYCFVVDRDGKKLSPTRENKGWYLIRKGKAHLVSQFPMVIKLTKVVEETDIDNTQIILGIDDGSKHVGIGMVQSCSTRSKVLLRAVLEQRVDVSKLIDYRRAHRRYRRNHKRYRKARFNNRGNSRKIGRVAPSIKQKRDSVLRVVNRLNRWVRITKIILEDSKFDIRSLVDGYKLYRWRYAKSNRLDENLRKASLLRDGFKCMECGKKNCKLEVHHINPRRFGGSNSINNLITLCSICHRNISGVELLHKDRYLMLVGNKSVNTRDAMHVMIGKKYLRSELSKIACTYITDGGTTANLRIDYGVDKSHSNDALVITGLKIKNNDCNVVEWLVKPLRKKIKSNIDFVSGFKHRDYVRYTKKDGSHFDGYIISLSEEKKVCSIRLISGERKNNYGINRLKLLNRFNGISWFKK